MISKVRATTKENAWNFASRRNDRDTSASEGLNKNSSLISNSDEKNITGIRIYRQTTILIGKQYIGGDKVLEQIKQGRIIKTKEGAEVIAPDKLDWLIEEIERLKLENRKLSAHNKHMHRQLELADRERRKVHGSLGGYK